MLIGGNAQKETEIEYYFTLNEDKDALKKILEIQKENKKLIEAIE